MAGSRVLRRLISIQMVQSLGELQAGVGIVDILRDAQVNASHGVDHLDQACEIHDDEVLNVQSGEAVHCIQCAACGRSEITAGLICVRENRIEHHVVLRGNPTIGRLALRHIHQGIAWNGNQVDFGAVRGNLRHHRGVSLMVAYHIVEIASD